LVGYELRVQKGEGSDILADRVEFMAIITNYNESVRKMQREGPLDEQKKAASNEAAHLNELRVRDYRFQNKETV
jgi:predicted aminopeptidase